MGRAIPLTFFDRPPPVVARALLGCELVRVLPDGREVGGRLVEVEAYLAEGDEGSHAFKGLKKSNASLFKEGGTLYVHPMRQFVGLDFVCGPAGVGGGVLLRALEPLYGVEVMMKNRGVEEIDRLANGPGKLCQALGIGRGMDGLQLGEGCPVVVRERAGGETAFEVRVTRRIGLSKGVEHELRFVLVSLAGDKP